MTSQPGYQRGDRIALVRTGDPCTRLRPGDLGITVTRWDPAQGQLRIRWDSGSTLTMLPGDGDQGPPPHPRPRARTATGPEDPLAAENPRRKE
jgi:hypothetical protein